MRFLHRAVAGVPRKAKEGRFNGVTFDAGGIIALGRSSIAFAPIRNLSVLSDKNLIDGFNSLLPFSSVTETYSGVADVCKYSRLVESLGSGPPLDLRNNRSESAIEL